MVEKGDKALVNKRESNKLTLNALRRSDATIEDIIGTAHQVCLYEFQLDRQTWKRRDVEGSLFVVKRSTQPRFQFIILNRLSPENHIEDVLDSTDLERNSPYIMYKSCKQELLGIWFYDEVECEKMHTLLAKITLANKVSPVGQNEQKKKEEKGSAAGNEISDLLSELETDKRDKRERSTSSDGGTRKDKPTTIKAAHAKVTKAQLKSALARLVQKDEFIDMLYKEIINQ